MERLAVITRPIAAPIVSPLGQPIGVGSHAWESGGGGTADLASQIIALYAGAGWSTYGAFLVESAADFIPGATATLVDKSGRANHATQGTAGAQPAYSATAVNGRPGITLDGGDFMVTGNIDLTAHTAYVLTVLFSDSVATAVTAAEFGGYSATVPGFRVSANTLTAGALYAQCRGNAGATTAASAASFSMATPGVVTCTFNTALATNEAEVYHNGVNVTNNRPENVNNATGLAAATTLTIGAVVGGGSGRLTGAIAAVTLHGGNTAIPVSTVVAEHALLRTRWSL